MSGSVFVWKESAVKQEYVRSNTRKEIAVRNSADV